MIKVKTGGLMQKCALSFEETCFYINSSSTQQNYSKLLF